MPAKDEIVAGGESDHAAIHDDGPVHGRGHDGGGQREEAEDEEWEQEAQSADVDGHAVFAEGPAMGGKGLAAEAFEEDAADGDHVGGQEGDEGEGDDGVKGDGGANVDEGEKDGHDEGDQDGVEGDVPAGGDVADC